MVWEIQSGGGGVKNVCHLSGGGVYFFWNNPFEKFSHHSSTVPPSIRGRRFPNWDTRRSLEAEDRKINSYS